jgi:hypothetical protein
LLRLAISISIRLHTLHTALMIAAIMITSIIAGLTYLSIRTR